jgi:hypothetical protein
MSLAIFGKRELSRRWEPICRLAAAFYFFCIGAALVRKSDDPENFSSGGSNFGLK